MNKRFVVTVIELEDVWTTAKVWQKIADSGNLGDGGAVYGYADLDGQVEKETRRLSVTVEHCDIAAICDAVFGRTPGATSGISGSAAAPLMPPSLPPPIGGRGGRVSTLRGLVRDEDLPTAGTAAPEPDAPNKSYANAGLDAEDTPVAPPVDDPRDVPF